MLIFRIKGLIYSRSKAGEMLILPSTELLLFFEEGMDLQKVDIWNPAIVA